LAKLKSLPKIETPSGQIAAKYAEGFAKELQLGSEVEQQCEWTCLLWLKDHWATQARQAQITLEQARERLADTQSKKTTIENLFVDSQFMNTVAQVYSKLFENTGQSCTVKIFSNCPYMGQRRDLLSNGSLASVFVTVLHKATFYAMLDRHPLDSGLIPEEYVNVYGIDLTNYEDLEMSLADGRFQKLYEVVVKRAMQLAGLPSKQPFEPAP
jgi:hypothetical protein